MKTKSTTDFKQKKEQAIQLATRRARWASKLKLIWRILTSEQYLIVSVRYKLVRNQRELEQAEDRGSNVVFIKNDRYEEQIRMYRTSKQVLDLAHTIIKKTKYGQ